MVALAWTYVVIVPISSEGAHLMFPPERCVRLLRIVFYGRAGAAVTHIRTKSTT